MNKLPKKNQPNKYLQLTGVVFQMGITIYLGAYIGKKLDNYFHSTKKIGTLIFTLLALLISIYNIINQLKKINETKE